MASILLVVSLITVLLLNTKCIFGNTCNCDMVKDILMNEMFDVKVENKQLLSRIEKIELTMNARTPISSQSARIDTGRIEMMETRINAIESKVPESTQYSRNPMKLQSLIAKALRSEKKERLKSELKIAAGLKKINDSLKVFKVKSDAIFASHIDDISERISNIKGELSENISHVRNEVMAVSNNVVKLANQASFLIENNITTIEMSLDAMNQGFIKMDADMDAMKNDFSKMGADITAVIDLVLLEQNAKCIPNCTNGGVCFRNNTCKCKPFTEGPRCTKVICEDKCYENGGKCVGPDICKCPEDRKGPDCDQYPCYSSPCNNGHCSSKGENYVSPYIFSDCYDVLHQGGITEDGVYNISTWDTHRKIQVYCDMETAGGGWTVFQNRFDGSVEFYRNFSEYENGFGDIHKEFWLGLKNLYELVAQGPSELRIDVSSPSGSEGYETFQEFSISPAPRYSLRIELGTGTIGDSIYDGLSYNNNSAFSTYDRDMDAIPGNCASHFEGAWWYRWCTHVDLNGKYCTPWTRICDFRGMIYNRFERYISLLTSRMMFRRV